MAVAENRKITMLGGDGMATMNCFCWNQQCFLLEPTFASATSEKTTWWESATSSDFFCYFRHQFLLEPAQASATSVGRRSYNQRGNATIGFAFKIDLDMLQRRPGSKGVLCEVFFSARGTTAVLTWQQVRPVARLAS
ncbi:uncharacterized protein [Triticum aestivum]|uniref:uncharacterized protein n=1 Tax=Triticum aestivum TaxID=4565 RepID=UPI001D010DF8|nr:uncharacterized protein LOC123110612 [Triticum aestivum]